jgi:hypothetical protein
MHDTWEMHIYEYRVRENKFSKDIYPVWVYIFLSFNTFNRENPVILRMQV